jgi:hypothetical protein
LDEAAGGGSGIIWLAHPPSLKLQAHLVKKRGSPGVGQGFHDPARGERKSHQVETGAVGRVARSQGADGRL